MPGEAIGQPLLVGEADLEHELALVSSTAAESSAGAFGPSSVMWRIDKEAVIFLGAGRALLLQLAHPWIATAITQHSRTLADPIGRFHRTFNAMFTIVFGTTEQALAAARRLHRRHAQVSGTLAEAVGPFAAGSRYEANDFVALRWVHATLIETALVATSSCARRSPPKNGSVIGPKLGSSPHSLEFRRTPCPKAGRFLPRATSACGGRMF